VCGSACEAEGRARILLRVHGSGITALQQALHDWQSGTGQAGVVLALLDRAAAQSTGRDALRELARKAVSIGWLKKDVKRQDGGHQNVRKVHCLTYA
jgi:hypothetical protein